MTDIYHNPRCSKSRQTLALLIENDVEPTVIEYLKTPLSAEQISQLLVLLDIPARDLLRKGESIYKELGLSDKSLTEKQLITAMAEHPKLIERPIVVHNEQARIGRPPEAVLEILD